MIKKESNQSIDLTPLMTPVSVLMSGVMISVSLFFGLKDLDINENVKNKQEDTAASSSKSSSQTTASNQSSQGTTKVELKEISYEGMPMKGNSSAKVVVIEFTDFQCPYCSRHNTQTYPTLASNYIDKGEVKYYSKQYPLYFHDKAQKASEAAECANDQGKYWEMHDKMFASQDKISVSDLKGYASALGLDTGKFNSCLDNGTYTQKVKDSVDYGSQNGVQGTPSFFIGEDIGGGKMKGFLIPGAYPFETFDKIIKGIKEKGITQSADQCSMTSDGALSCNL